MSNVYNSIYTGNQIDGALKVVIDSGVSVSQLQVLVGVTAGTGVASKAMVLDANKNFININSLSVSVLKASYLNLVDGTADPVAIPAVSRKLLYFKNGAVWIKSSDGTTKELKSGETKVVTFTSQTEIVIDHQFGDKFPNVVVSINDKDTGADIEYTDVNTTTVRFNSAQSGTITCRIV